MGFSRLFSFFLLSATTAFAAPIVRLGEIPVDWPGEEKFSGKIEASAREQNATLGNGVVNVRADGDSLIFNLAGNIISCPEIASAEIETPDGRHMPLSFKRISSYSKKNYVPPKIPIRHVDASNEDGALLGAVFEDESGRIRLHWAISLRGNASYFTQHFLFSRTGSDGDSAPLRLTKLRLGTFAPEHSGTMHTVGKVPGSPVALNENVLCGIEQPSFTPVQLEGGNRIALELDCDLDLMPAGKPLRLSSMIGYFPKSQQRRAFNFYIERERAAPSRHFLLYNGWYDFGLSPTEKALGEAIETYGNELVKKRNVRIDAFVLDDGWDDPVRELWAPSPTKFPDGLRPLRERAEKFGAGFGIWISPSGGHFGVNERLESCRNLDGISENALEFDLADPVYENWFTRKCRTLMRDEHVVYFKWDRVGESFSQHFLNLLDIAGKLRKEQPGLFINATSGTWPSPFWLNHVDSTWRGGADIAFYNPNIGDRRDQWISYRDSELISNVVSRAPLYPINSVMHHGIALGTHYQGATCAEAGNDLRREIFSYFALGSNLQELYVDFHLLAKTPERSKAWALGKIRKSPNNLTQPDEMRNAIRSAKWIPGEKIWDCIAEATRWANSNACALVDMHWVAGTPCNPPGAYAFAGWHRGNGVIYLRNASDKTSAIEFSLEEAFELPASEPAESQYGFRVAYVYGNDDYTPLTESVSANKKISFELNPLEVRILEARRVPASKSNLLFNTNGTYKRKRNRQTSTRRAENRGRKTFLRRRCPAHRRNPGRERSGKCFLRKQERKHGTGNRDEEHG